MVWLPIIQLSIGVLGRLNLMAVWCGHGDSLRGPGLKGGDMQSN